METGARGRCPDSFLFEGKVQIESQPDRICLLVWLFACVVLMLVVGVELDVFADWDVATGIERGGAPLVVLPLVVGFRCDVRDEMN